MKKKRILSILLTVAIILGLSVTYNPISAEAAWDTEYGKLSIWHLDNDFVDGKFRFNVKFQYEQYSYYSHLEYGLNLQNIKLLNSAGKTMATWKDCSILKNGGTLTKHFSIDFSEYPSDTYKFSYTVNPQITSDKKTYSISVKHTGGKITYNSSKYIYDTDGNKKVKVYFKTKNLKGYATKIQIFDSNNKVVRSFSGSEIAGNDSNYYVSWGMTDSKGNKVSKGTYTFKITANGKTCTKKLNLVP